MLENENNNEIDLKAAFEAIKKRLALFGITLKNYLEASANLTGNFFIPAKLAIFNSELRKEQAFYYIANKVFVACDCYCFGIPGQFNYNWYEVVGKSTYEIFKSAVFEEINQRVLSNSFPEFQNAQVLVPSDFTLASNSFNDGSDINNYLNKITQRKLSLIDWSTIDPQEQYNPSLLKNTDIMINDMSNLKLSHDAERFLIAKADGTFSIIHTDKIAQAEKVKGIDATVQQHTSNISSLYDRAQKIDQRLSVVEASQRLTAPFIEVWSSSTKYKTGDFCFHDSSIFFAVLDNMNETPTLNSKYWQCVNKIFRDETGDLVFNAGTDLKFSFTNPNFHHYVALDAFVTENSTLSVKDIHVEINKRLTEAGGSEEKTISIEQTVEVLNHLFGLSLNTTTTDQNIKNDISQKLPAILHAYGFPYANQVMLFDVNDRNLLDDVINKNSHDFSAYGRYLRIGHGDTGTGGSNKITRDNLPDVSWDTRHQHYVSGTTGSKTLYSSFDKLKLCFVSESHEFEYIKGSCSYTHANQQWPFFCLNFTDARSKTEWCYISDCRGIVDWDSTAQVHDHIISLNTDEKGETLQLNPHQQIEFEPSYQAVYTLKTNQKHQTDFLKKIWVNIRPINSFQNARMLLSGYSTTNQVKNELLPNFWNEKLGDIMPDRFIYVTQSEPSDVKALTANSDIVPQDVSYTIERFKKLNAKVGEHDDGIATIRDLNKFWEQLASPNSWPEDFKRAIEKFIDESLKKAG